MIVYDKLFELMKKQGKNTSHIRKEKIIGQETLRKLKLGTGFMEEYLYTVPSTGEKEKRVREVSIDSKAIESLCTWLNCQPSDIMEVIPNRWENEEILCKRLGCDFNSLPLKVKMPEFDYSWTKSNEKEK